MVYAIVGREGRQTVTFDPPIEIFSNLELPSFNTPNSGSVELVDPEYGSHMLTYHSNVLTPLVPLSTEVPAGKFSIFLIGWRVNLSGSILSESVSYSLQQDLYFSGDYGPVRKNKESIFGIETNSELVNIDIPDVSGKDKTVLWQNEKTGHIWMHDLKGSAIETSHGLALLSNRDWHIAGRGDLNNDGQEDVFLRNTPTGHNWV